MNQTKKRLSIINLAISITDIETIQLQVLKLGLLRSDSKIQEIISMLQAENYAQAQGLISTYIETPMEEILQRSAQKDEDIQKQKEQAIIEEFDLFVEEPEKEEEPVKEIDNLEAFVDPVAEPKKLSTEQVNYDTLLNVDANDILPDNIELDLSHTQEDTFFDSVTNRSIDEVFTQNISKDTFFDDPQHIPKEEISKEEVPTEKVSQKISEPIAQEEVLTEETVVPDLTGEQNNRLSPYKAISYIDQKFQNALKQYPPIESSDKKFFSVVSLLHKISLDGYNEEDIEKTIEKIEELSLDNKAEASQLLLIIASTESKYAQFRLARALYKGEILKKNLSESYTLINSLAVNDDYPEAICDLGQFYEYGIGIDKDITKAKLLYKQAMDLGIKRAEAHYQKLNKADGGLFSFFKK
jgi:hypothetical protein